MNEASYSPPSSGRFNDRLTWLCAPSQPTTKEAVSLVSSPLWSKVALTRSPSCSAATNLVSYSTPPPFRCNSSTSSLSVTFCGTIATNAYGVSSGWNRMRASVRSRVATTTDVTRLAFSRNGPAIPAMSKISSVRGKIASAFECSDCDACSSISRHRKPRRAHSFARNRPTGPAPTIRMSVSVALSAIVRASIGVCGIPGQRAVRNSTPRTSRTSFP